MAAGSPAELTAMLEYHVSAHRIDGHGSLVTANNASASAYTLSSATAFAVGDWIAVYPTDVTNPGAIDGESYRLADSDNLGAGFDTVGVAMQALIVLGLPEIRQHLGIRPAGIALLRPTVVNNCRCCFEIRPNHGSNFHHLRPCCGARYQ